MNIKLVVIALLLAGVVAGGFLYKKYRVAPDITLTTIPLTDLSGNRYELRDDAHKVYVVNFFATWCGPCIKELPALAYIAHHYSKLGWKFVCVSDEAPERLQRLAQTYANESLVFVHCDKPLKDLQIYTVPTTYILNKQLEIQYKTTNGENWMSEKTVQQLDEIDRVN